MELGSDFFERHTVTVARQLLGKHLVRSIGGRTWAGMVTETEAYHGVRDRACHASRGLTPRTRVMFGSPGRTYVYLVYGMYHCLNFVTMREGFPAAVLIRGVLIGGFPAERTDGPGKVCRAMRITRKQNGLPPGNGALWLEDRGVAVPRGRVRIGPRVGVAYAGACRHRPWRFRLSEPHTLVP